MSSEKTIIMFSDGLKLEMIKVEAHKTKQDFYIGRTEVTQAQWRAVMGTDPALFKGDNLPVEQVSWKDTMSFCERLNRAGKVPRGWKFTLPTEAQWENAARGGIKSKGYKYIGSNIVDEVAWYKNNSGSKTHPVGRKKANELGLYDMSGNVSELCLDEWKEEDPHLQGLGPERIAMGGSFLFNISFGIERFICFPSDGHPDMGFRLALVRAQ